MIETPIEISVTCSMCGSNSVFELRLESDAETAVQAITRSLSKSLRKWSVQRNGDNLDCYCSKECAK